VTACPECSSADLDSLGLERGERLDDGHCVLVSRFRCRSCQCEFREIQVTSWRREILKHGNPDWLILTEAEA
jgi:transposase-like protein